MALDELALMKELGGISADIRNIKESQASQGVRIGNLEISLDKKTEELYTFINKGNEALHARINEHITSRGSNGNGKPQGRYRAVMAHPATQVGGAGTAGAIIMWLLQHIKIQ